MDEEIKTKNNEDNKDEQKKDNNENEKEKEEKNVKEEQKEEEKKPEIKDDKNEIKNEDNKNDEAKKEEGKNINENKEKDIDEEKNKKENDLYKESTEPFMQIASKELIEILNNPENRKCFDCESTPANWLCANNAIFLCSKCAGEHRGYGTIISNLKFMMLDSLNEFQIEIMKRGGNKKLDLLLQQYNIDKKKIDKLILYSSKLLEYHRDYLYNKLAGKKDPKPPTKFEANKIMNNFKDNPRPPLQKIKTKDDIFNDNVKLITTLQGYALGGEFPIYGKCTIEGIKEETLIEPGVAKNPSFLELVGIKQLKCYSIDLSTISPCLSGTINESFLIDENGNSVFEANHGDAAGQIPVKVTYDATITAAAGTTAAKNKIPTDEVTINVYDFDIHKVDTFHGHAVAYIETRNNALC